MRTLVLTRGPQGAGKTTTLESIGLGGYILSGDQVRQLLASPVMGRNGRIGLSQEHDRRVWPMLFEILGERMARGELIVVDATHPNAGAFSPYRRLATRHRYRMVCLDFSPIPLELALSRNAGRAAHKVVPESSLRRTYEACQRGQIPDDVDVIRWQEDGSHGAALDAYLAEPVRELDLSSYAAVHHIGDIQGCFTPLAGPDGLMGAGFQDDRFYIFIGDLCDRGPESGEVVRWTLEHMDRPNVRIHRGNHEDFLDAWARGEEVRDPEFVQRTIPQLAAAGVTPEQVERLCGLLVDCTRYRFRDRRVLVTHAGLPTVPDRPERLSSRQYSHGTGNYGDPIDAVFSDRAPAGWVQVHGHRNPRSLPLHAGPRSYNLEGQVEFGGQLRGLVLEPDPDRPDGKTTRFRGVEVPSRRYRSIATRLRQGDKLVNTHTLPPWIGRDDADADNNGQSATLTPEALAALREHPLIREKVSRSRPHVSSFNFTRDAFFRKEWDALNVTARGLFIDPERRAIVARSYDKFFNVGERPETQPDALASSLTFPVTVYAKENGYLGILGYDVRNEDLLFCSKSSPDSEFAGWFKELTLATLPEGGAERLRRYLRDTESSMAFEVIDPVRDPHIIEYDAARVILLDVIRRAPAFERVPHATLLKVGKRFGLEVKRRAMHFTDWAGLSRWLEVAMAPGYRYRGEHLEGFVLEDAAGFQTKLKLDYYNHWKRLRSLKDRVVKTRANGKPLGRDISDPRVKEFVEWAQRQPDAALLEDIISVRKRFVDGTGADHAYVPPRAAPDPEVHAFRRMLESLARKGDDYAIKPATADRVVGLALADDRKLEILKASPLRVRLLLAATDTPDRAELAERVGLDIDGPGPVV